MRTSISYEAIRNIINRKHAGNCMQVIVTITCMDNNNVRRV